MNGESPQSAPQTGWQFKSDVANAAGPAAPVAAQAPAQTPEQTVSWTASEFVANQKTAGWYAMLALGAIVSAILVFFLTHHDWISSTVVIVIAIAFGIMASRQPRVLHYAIDSKGVHIENKSYFFADFKSFSIINEGAVKSIMFLPLKRFMPGLSIYYDPQDEEKIFNLLSNYLPMENRQPDFVDRLMNKVRY